MTAKLITDYYQAAERFVDWLADRVEADASGSARRRMEVDPVGSIWLGRLAPSEEIQNSDLGDRAERLEPCAVGMRLMPKVAKDGVVISVKAAFAVWERKDGVWLKTGPVEVSQKVTIDLSTGNTYRIIQPFQDLLSSISTNSGLKVAVEIEIKKRNNATVTEVEITLVNYSSSDNRDFARGRLFECQLEVSDLQTQPFLLEALPDSFRYDRRLPAYGINCGVADTQDGTFKTVDLPRFDKRRPEYWNVDSEEPDLTFETLSNDPIASAEKLYKALADWGDEAWDIDRLAASNTGWTQQMSEEAKREIAFFDAEKTRIKAGIEILRTEDNILRAFKLMNKAKGISAREKYDRWRPFQFGFLLANLDSCRGNGSEIVDIVWFSTGGGKTETYLGLILTAAFYDRMRGKITGITAWSRFPLRLLSLQQTQRFANALAAAEVVRRQEGIAGDPFGLGFLVGSGATPNEFKDTNSVKERGQWDFEDSTIEDRLKMLKVCPFCREDSITTRFKRNVWRFEHRCGNESCDWPSEHPLPIWVVDVDVWRYLPTVIVGTLDKAAGVAMQANMRGLVTAPLGICSRKGHGHTYAPRWKRPHGCLVPGCDEPRGPLRMDEQLYGVTYRLQDELHLLRDSLGAVDAHYEALLDHLQFDLSGTTPKILASSATLSGYERQSRVLYSREARVFPHPEPKVGQGFWAGDTTQMMRAYTAVAPRGQTIEYAVDRMVVSLQTAIRELAATPREILESIGIDPSLSAFLIDTYGTDVVYGNTLRDLDALVRSAETQWSDIPDPSPNVAALTGRTIFSDVSDTLEKLEQPASDFSKRLHVVAASSMMSHGVDIDRLNVMVMLGLPLTTAEFIQATARVGRRWPSLAFIVHKIGRERDASIYRAFPKYVDQGDRFVEPIPITGRSRRVLEQTIPGLAFARILLKHEPQAGGSLAKAHKVRAYLQNHAEFKNEEIEAICGMLGYDDDATAALKKDVAVWYEHFCRNVGDPANGNAWANALGKGGSTPMRSLRDVEEQVRVWGSDDV